MEGHINDMNGTDFSVEQIELDSTFEMWEVSSIDVNEAKQENSYIRSLADESTIHLLQEHAIRRAWETKKELGLFRLFLNNSYLQNMVAWTNPFLARKNAQSIRVHDVQGYLGLELMMSLIQCNDIDQYWCQKRFYRNNDIQNVMSRDRFQMIRANLRTGSCSPDTPSEPRAKLDPLYFARDLLQHFQKNSADVAVPDGASAFDENSARTRARTSCKTYMPCKPDKYGIRFYACVNWKSLYLHSMWDNGSGNKTGVSPPKAYIEQFPNLRHLHRKAELKSVVGRDSPSLLWCLQLAHQTQKKKSIYGKRIIFMDNFYTRHTVGQQLLDITDNEIRITGFTKNDISNLINVDRYC